MCLTARALYCGIIPSTLGGLHNLTIQGFRGLFFLSVICGLESNFWPYLQVHTPWRVKFCWVPDFSRHFPVSWIRKTGTGPPSLFASITLTFPASPSTFPSPTVLFSIFVVVLSVLDPTLDDQGDQSPLLPSSPPSPSPSLHPPLHSPPQPFCSLSS